MLWGGAQARALCQALLRGWGQAQAGELLPWGGGRSKEGELTRRSPRPLSLTNSCDRGAPAEAPTGQRPAQAPQRVGGQSPDPGWARLSLPSAGAASSSEDAHGQLTTCPEAAEEGIHAAA